MAKIEVTNNDIQTIKTYDELSNLPSGTLIEDVDGDVAMLIYKYGAEVIALVHLVPSNDGDVLIDYEYDKEGIENSLLPARVLVGSVMTIRP